VWGVPLLLAAFSAAQQPPQSQTPQSNVQESPVRAPVSDNQIVNPASSKAPPPLPKAAFEGKRTPPDDEGADWQKAHWTHTTLRGTGKADNVISLAAPSMVMIKASWQAHPEITVNVLKDGKVLASTKSTPGLGTHRTAAAHVKVPTTGPVTVRATGTGPLTIDLYVGVLAAAP
jgi:hypothetical protein